MPDQSARWKLAKADDQMTYARFSGVLGVDLDPARLPIVIHLLNRMEREVLDCFLMPNLTSTAHGRFSVLWLSTNYQRISIRLSSLVQVNCARPTSGGRKKQGKHSLSRRAV